MFAVPENTIAVAGAPAASHPALVARAYAADRARWRDQLSYDPDQRYTALIDSTDGQEVWLMTWLPGQSTDLHDHGAVSGAFTLVSGTLTETVARGGERPAEVLNALSAGQTRVFGPGYVHQVTNTGTDPAISIHVYREGRPPMGRYRLDPVTGPQPV
ncbi:cysteine dioxygenase [Actinokineospora sp. HUAS TT18]|uniref:cysteine dioxygenase n=1 Tax=Actinokineospora sp. HUAS TT18 TaxID=3447451 RepID=UPI003F5209B4